MNISSGRIWSAQKVLIYGPEGIGKTSFAAAFPDVLFSDTEGSTKHIDVKRFDRPMSWKELLDQAHYVASHTDCCHTYAIDTLDWAETLCIRAVCEDKKKKSIEDISYGKGYVMVAEEFKKLFDILDSIVDSGINVCITAHAKITKFEQPDELGAYDRWGLKLGKHTAPIVKEWTDMILFANYKTYVVSTDNKGEKNKVQGGKRVMYTAHHPCWDAKNRHGLAEELPLSYDAIAHCIPTDPAKNADLPFTMDSRDPAKDPQTAPVSLSGYIAQQERESADFEEVVSEEEVQEFLEYSSGIPNDLWKLITGSGVTEKDVRKAVAARGYYPFETPISKYDREFVEKVLIGAWQQVLAMIQEQQ